MRPPQSSAHRRSAANTAYLPMHDEIVAACARIRAGWDESERRKRAALPPRHNWVELATVTLGVLEGRQ
ncbi:MAG TPA: hypothetical protein VND64_04095 [Pirellulales bacterium]|nr:hypothetical protein [Pirellulales bacterium]